MSFLLESNILRNLIFFLLGFAKIAWVTSEVAEFFGNDSKVEELDQCLTKLPQVNVNGMPTDPIEIENACKVFNVGIMCLDNWTNTCLPIEAREKVKSSVIGAIETFTLLCTDMSFQEQYLKHADCYNDVSPYWDACTRKFLDTLMIIDQAADARSLCCVRFRYQQCLEDVATSFCSTNATEFLEDLAQSLMRSTLETYATTICTSFNYTRCRYSEGSSTQSFVNILSKANVNFLHAILSFYTIWISFKRLY